MICFMTLVSTLMVLFPHLLISIFIDINDPANAAVIAYARRRSCSAPR